MESSRVTVLDREVYGMSEAARLLGLRTARLRNWIDGYQRGDVSYPPVVRPASTGSDVVTWGEFVEAGYLTEYRRRGVSLQGIRPVVQKLRDRFGIPYPLAHKRPFVAGKELVMEVEGEEGLDRELRMVVIKNGQLILTPPAQAFFEKVEFRADEVGLLRPDGPRSPVVINPERAFGSPAVGGVRTEVLFELFSAGESQEAVAEAYDLSVSDVEAAVRFESNPERLRLVA